MWSNTEPGGGAEAAQIDSELALHGTIRRSAVFLGERRVTLLNRFLGITIDLIIALALYYIGQRLGHWYGPLGASLYLGLKDGLGSGQSLGKRIVGTTVVEDSLGLDASIKDSIRRNLAFAIAPLLLGAPLLWILFFGLCLPWILLEGLLVYFVPTGVRLGDVLANTYVDELHETLGSDLPLP